MQNNSDASIEQILIHYIKEVLKISTNFIDDSLPLSDFGFDSISYKELALHLEKYFKVEFSPAVFFTHTSIKALAGYIARSIDMPTPEKTAEPESTLIVNQEPIAIIGMQAYLPQSPNLDEFWKHLEAGDDLVTEIPATRWDWQKYYANHEQASQKSNSKWCASLDNFDQFDAEFFNISAREANLLDPQQRLFMEIAWKTIEDAGQIPSHSPHTKPAYLLELNLANIKHCLHSKKYFTDISPQVILMP